MTSIGYAAFYGTNLSTIYIPTSVQTMSNGLFEKIQNPDFTIYCGAPQKPDGWDDSWNLKKYGGSDKWPVERWGVTREEYNEIVNS